MYIFLHIHVSCFSCRDGVDVFVGIDDEQEVVAVKQVLRRSSQIFTQILIPINKANLVKLLVSLV